MPDAARPERSFFIARQAGKDGQPGRIGARPAGPAARAHGVAVELEHRTTRGTPGAVPVRVSLAEFVQAVVVAVDGLKFTGAPKVGDEISVFAELAKQGRTSMRIAVEAVARERDGEKETNVASGEFTFVALDENDRPRTISA